MRGYVQTPLETLYLTFEDQLGNGPEFSGSLASQQIIYPQYAGLGSPDIDCGSAAMIPILSFEAMGAFMLYTDIVGGFSSGNNGDCDPIDLIEFIAKSGPVMPWMDERRVTDDDADRLELLRISDGSSARSSRHV